MDYIASIAGLLRLGYAVLLLSTRLSTEALANLLRKTKAKALIVAPGQSRSADNAVAEYEIPILPFYPQSDYDIPLSSDPRVYAQLTQDASSRVSFIIHSSGSTGLPKPIFQTHRACLTNYSSGAGFRAFLTLPLYHNHGLATFFRGIYSGNITYFFNANLPLSSSNLLQAMEAAQPESFHGVPYGLKLLAESDEGIRALAKCKLVLFGGSSCPDELGDKLVEAGVHLVGHYGATEMGQLMTSFRDQSDKAWNYMRPLPSAFKYLQFPEVSKDVFECVVLDGLPTKVISNSDDPPNSFHTKDTFSAHPTIPNAWKYLGRIDDRVTLVNGEKVLPVPYENQIRENELVKDCCIFGVGKAFPGICIVPSIHAKDLSKEDLLDKLWPTFEANNARVEGFSQISREMVSILDFGIEYPQTDKGTLIRAAFYRKFENLINSVYKRFERHDSATTLTLSLEELTEYLLDIFRSRTGHMSMDADTDFFAAGVDSLQALAVRGRILREVDLAESPLGQNVIFDYPNVRSLAKHLYALRTGVAEEESNEIEEMRSLIAKYSTFSDRNRGVLQPTKETVIITGTTGSLGAHILAQIANRDEVRLIYCLVRADSPASAADRVCKTLTERGIDASLSLKKVVCLPSDFSRSDLGLSQETLDDLRHNLTTVIHSAWAVNFNLGVRSFEQQHIKGTWNLLNLCLATKTARPARLFFCSSISAAAGTPIPASIREAHVADLAHAQNMGYARSKLVTEHILRAAAAQTGMEARVLRIGQIVGDSSRGVWNTTEAIPLMIRSAATIGALPALEETPSWMPVDEVARAVVELSRLGRVDERPWCAADVVFHVQNSRLFNWTAELLPALKDAGLEFETVSQREWVRRLRDGEQDPSKNPTIKLLDFFEGKYDNDNPGRKGLVFETGRTGEQSEAVRDGYDIIGSGLINKIVSEWKKVW